MAKDEVRADIAAAAQKLRGTSKLFARKELKALPGVLWEGETVDSVIQGRYGNREGIAAITDRRLLFLGVGVMGSVNEDFPLEKISSVQCSTAMLSGKITVFASGNKAEIINCVPKEAVALFAETLRNRTNRHSTAGSADAAPISASSTQMSPIEQVKQLGELHAAGILSKEEFEAKKAELLKRI